MRWIANACGCPQDDTATEAFTVRDRNFRSSDLAVRLMRCSGCGTLFPERVPSADTLHEAYRGYYTQRPRSPWWRRAVRRLIETPRRAYLDRDTPPNALRILDYGCGAGDYLRRIPVERSGAALFGVERDRAPGASDAFVQIDDGELEATGPFDWITLGHVLEHLPDPDPLLGRLAAALSADGGLWIATPNARSFLLTAAGPWARDIDFPRHMRIFTPEALSDRLALAGLEVRFIAAPRLNSALNALDCWRNFVADGELTPARKFWKSAVLAASLMAHVLAPQARRYEQSPEIVVIAKPRARAR